MPEERAKHYTESHIIKWSVGGIAGLMIWGLVTLQNAVVVMEGMFQNIVSMRESIAEAKLDIKALEISVSKAAADRYTGTQAREDQAIINENIDDLTSRVTALELKVEALVNKSNN